MPSSALDDTKAYVGEPATMAIDSAPSSSVYFEPSVILIPDLGGMGL